MDMDNWNIYKLPFDSEKFSEAWQEWLAYRRERRLPTYKPIGLKNFFTKLVRESDNEEEIAILILKQSIENNWQGIFPLKNLPNGKQQTVSDTRKASVLSSIAARYSKP